MLCPSGSGSFCRYGLSRTVLVVPLTSIPRNFALGQEQQHFKIRATLSHPSLLPRFLRICDHVQPPQFAQHLFQSQFVTEG